MNLLLFNLAVDSEHVTLGFALKWIKELARHFDHVDVVTMYEGKYDLPDNTTVWSVGREKGYSEIRRVWRFYCIVHNILNLRKIDVAFTHMIHIFAVLFWPVAKIKGIKNLLWFAHGAKPLGVRVAQYTVDKIVSSTPEGFRLPSKKVEFIGQGIDTLLFAPKEKNNEPVFSIITVGRISPVKGLDVLIEALQGWKVPDNRPWKLTVIGSGASNEEIQYETDFKKRALALSDYGKVDFWGRLDPPEIADLLRRADVFVNLSATGSLDKAIVEAMSTGCPILSCNDSFLSIARREGFDSCIVKSTPGSLREGLNRLSRLDPAARADLSKKLRSIAVRDHSLDSLISRIVSNLTQLSAGYAHHA